MNGPSISDQALAGSGAAQAVVDEVELAVQYVANVVDRMRTAVLYGVDVELGGPEDARLTGMRTLPDDDAGAIIGVLRTLATLLANTDVAVAKIVGQPTIGSMDPADWPVQP